MVKPRIIEPDHGIQGEYSYQAYDASMRKMRDRGLLETNLMLEAGIRQGLVLEIGTGPGYSGLEWLKKTENSRLKSLDISPDMIVIANRNAREYGLEARVEYIEGDAQDMPFDSDMFDGVFANGALHEWEQPEKVFNEIHRVLKTGGIFFINDMRRDMNPLIKWLIGTIARPREIRPGLISSVNACYTVEEIRSVLKRTNLKTFNVRKRFASLVITGEKTG